MKRIKLAMSSKVQLEYIDKEDIGNEIKWYLRKYSRVIDKNEEVIGVQIKAEDITEKKNQEIERAKLESYLRNQQKLESIGTLASGVAHEINNPINGILNYAQIIFDSNIEDKSIKEYAGEIISETERVSEIVKNLLQFSRQNKQEHSYATIEDIILKTLSLVKTVLKHDQIGLDLNLESDIPKIKCRSQQIQQVIMNLVTNARDALNEKYPNYNENKKIKISCKNYNSEGRDWIRLVVEDYGPGISKHNINKIFDPFFTTKGKFKGTGLGLSISYGIVNEHHGDIIVESEEGKFTRFIVNLPCDNGWEIE
jgi:signal transduction histidine kinase